MLGPLILAGTGVGMVIAPAINTGTFGVAPQDAGVASATVTVGQMLGGSIGTSLLNTSTVVVEAVAPGGQAGTTSMIENLLGFPNGSR